MATLTVPSAVPPVAEDCELLRQGAEKRGGYRPRLRRGGTAKSCSATSRPQRRDPQQISR
ncbi:hypothetical protein E2562_000588 [Oryza meyeriana var. granulata]|uniref:Uncharacterized protein n=1 Tax=Oryza meyeriana var. granulata TaxID=110450 RepID=A0A6G1DUS1_9ORYZ|nr:hypothetical protein E2562_000588 [Oryza meyeriana var. granulata]